MSSVAETKKALAEVKRIEALMAENSQTYRRIVLGEDELRQVGEDGQREDYRQAFNRLDREMEVLKDTLWFADRLYREHNKQYPYPPIDPLPDRLLNYPY